MDLMNVLGSLMGQGGQQPEEIERGYDQVAGQLPSGMLSDGLAAAFRSQETPPFAQMLSGLFGQSNQSQQAGVVNMLLQAAGPMVLQKLMGGQGGGSGGGLESMLGGMMSGGQATGGGDLMSVLGGLMGGGGISEEQAAQFTPEQIQELASHVEKEDPSIIDRISSFYSEHPTLVKTVGAAALGIAMKHIMSRQQEQS
jgi:hypothetical protein